jgi:hypothetical protein
MSFPDPVSWFSAMRQITCAMSKSGVDTAALGARCTWLLYDELVNRVLERNDRIAPFSTNESSLPTSLRRC